MSSSLSTTLLTQHTWSYRQLANQSTLIVLEWYQIVNFCLTVWHLVSLSLTFFHPLSAPSSDPRRTKNLHPGTFSVFPCKFEPELEQACDDVGLVLAVKAPDVTRCPGLYAGLPIWWSQNLWLYYNSLQPSQPSYRQHYTTTQLYRVNKPASQAASVASTVVIASWPPQWPLTTTMCYSGEGKTKLLTVSTELCFDRAGAT